MQRTTGTYVKSTTAGEVVRAFVPRPLPPARPALTLDTLQDANLRAELALARLSGVSGLVPSVDWLLHGAIHKEALLTSQIEGTQATLADIFDGEAGLAVSNPDDVEEVTNYVRAFRHVQQQLRSSKGLPISVRLVCQAHKLLMAGVRGGTASSRASCGARRTGSAERGQATRPSCHRRRSGWRRYWPTWRSSSTRSAPPCRRWSGSDWCMASSKPSTLSWTATAASAAC